MIKTENIYTTITAHSGCEGTPVDSIESVESGILYEADIIEVDVRADKNGKLVLSHNRDEQQLYSGSTGLTQVFELIQIEKRICLNCDIKETKIIPNLLETARQYGITEDRLYLSGSVTRELLREIPEIRQKCRVQWNIEEAMVPLVKCKLTEDDKEHLCGLLYTDPWRVIREVVPNPDVYIADLVRMATELSVTTFNIPEQYASKERILFFHANGIMVSVWTVNEPDEITRLLQLGIRNITTKNIRIAKKLQLNFHKKVKPVHDRLLKGED
jgi:glycerophosphoryl diester phosphodiesterase